MISGLFRRTWLGVATLFFITIAASAILVPSVVSAADNFKGDGAVRSRDYLALCGRTDNSIIYCTSNGDVSLTPTGFKADWQDAQQTELKVTGGILEGTIFRRATNGSFRGYSVPKDTYVGEAVLRKDARDAGLKTKDCILYAQLSSDKTKFEDIGIRTECSGENNWRLEKDGTNYILVSSPTSIVTQFRTQIGTAAINNNEKPLVVVEPAAPGDLLFYAEQLSQEKILTKQSMQAMFKKWGCTGMDSTDKMQGKCSLNWYMQNELNKVAQKCFAQAASTIPHGAPESTKSNIWKSKSKKDELSKCFAQETQVRAGEVVFVNEIDLQDIYSRAQEARRLSTEETERRRAELESTTNPNANSSETTCGIDGIGWLVCPTMNFLAGMNDGAFSYVSKWLEVEPKILDQTGTNAGTFQAWSAFKDIANVLFIIVFLFIVFSQITNMGVSNYGVKKMLPRLIIGAILVNLSFYICQIAVDISNILGYTLAQTIAGITDLKSANTGHTAGLTWVGVIGGILAGVGVIVLAAMAITVPVLLASLLAIVVVVVILIGRQAGVILLVAISPLAFVAWLLPNTEQWFKKWWKMFSGLLLVFPIIALLYGGASLASNVLATAAVSNPADPDELMQLAALGVLLIPLGLTPMVLKGSLNSLGSIGGKLSALSTKANSGVTSKAKANAANSGLGARWKEMGQNSERKRALRIARRRSTSKLDRTGVGRALGWDRGSYAAESAVDKTELENAELAYTYQYNKDAAKALSSTNSNVQAVAAKELADKGEYGADQMVAYLKGGGQITNLSMAETLTKMKGVHAGLAETGTAALIHFQSGNSEPFGVTAAELDTNTSRGLSKLGDEALSKQSTSAINANGNVISASRAQEMLANQRLYAGMSANNVQALQAIAGQSPNSPSPAPQTPLTPNQLAGLNAQQTQALVNQHLAAASPASAAPTNSNQPTAVPLTPNQPSAPAAPSQPTAPTPTNRQPGSANSSPSPSGPKQTP